MKAGEVYGFLTVKGLASHSTKERWLCQCECGRMISCTVSQLMTGRKKHCGCKSKRNGHKADIRGRRIHRLVALEPLDQRDSRGSVIWRCRCDCGREINVSYNMLIYGNMRSCGCRKREHDQALGTYLNHVDGTSIEMLRSKKLPTNNTSGIRGVYFSRGKYNAKIVIKGHQYHLGSFDTLEEAASARQAAEESVRRQLIAAWEQWNEQGSEDAAWAESHPFTFEVKKDKQNQLTLKIGS